MTTKKWKIFLVTHGPVRDDYYANDPKFSYENFILFNVSGTVLTHSKFQVINAHEIAGYEFLGKWYAEAEVIYNIWIQSLYKDLDYIGFVHWDFELKSLSDAIGYNVCDAISSAVENAAPFISFATFDFEYAYNLNVMLDIKYPNQCYGTEGVNCFDSILEAYNVFYGRNVRIQDIRRGQINLCSAFLMSKAVFEEIMPFYVHVIQSRFLDQFDNSHAYRFQGGIMERYIGICSAHYKLVDIPLVHHYNHKKEASRFELRFEKIRKILFGIRKKMK